MASCSREIRIGRQSVGIGHPTYFIADIAANHDGSLARAKDLIYLAKEAGADAAKFQHFKAETIVSDYGFATLGGQMSHQASWKKPVFEVYQDASVDLGWTPVLKETCDEAGITFFTTPYAFDLVDHVDPFVSAYKIGSGDITWTAMIEYIAARGKPCLLASGAATLDEVMRAATAILAINPDLVLMQCNTNYTASLENFKYINLNVLKTYRDMYPDVILGLSDHTPGHAAVLGAVSLGATVIEKHFTDDNSRTGPDHKFAMNPRSWRDMVDRARELEAALGTGIKRIEENELDTVVVQRRSIRAKPTARGRRGGRRIRSGRVAALPRRRHGSSPDGRDRGPPAAARRGGRTTSAMDRSRVGIIIPALNEERSIGVVVRRCRDYGTPIVVDDGSSDGTGATARREGAEVVRHEVNRGYDGALNSGFRKAADLGCEYAVTIDADGQHNPEILGKVLSLLETCDVVLGVRNKRPRVAEHCFACLTRWMYGISDPLCGLKAYRIQVYRALGHFDSCGSIGTELALFAARKGLRIAQLPVMVGERADAPRFGRSLRANGKIFRAMFLFLGTCFRAAH